MAGRRTSYAVLFVCSAIGRTVPGGDLAAAAETPRHVTVCAGEHEERCPPHDRHFGCPNKAREDIAKDVCRERPREILVLATRSGDRCGYAVLDITCPGGTLPGRR